MVKQWTYSDVHKQIEDIDGKDLRRSAKKKKTSSENGLKIF